MQHVELSGPILARQLDARALDKVQDYAVRQLLHLHVRRVGLSKLAHVVLLGALGGPAALRGQRAEDDEAV